MVINEIQRIAKEENVSVFGVAASSKMRNEPAGHRPEEFIPGAQTLICFGIPIPRDVFITPSYSTETIWRAQNLLYRRLDSLALRFSVLLEESGARAMPIYGCMPMGINNSGVVGYMNQLRMAEVTGIGVIGKNGLLLNSRHGSRLMLGSLITTASLPAMRYPEYEEPGCPSDCQICSDECPVNAIMPQKKQVKINRCGRYTAKTPLMSRLKILFLVMRDKKAAARYMSMSMIDEHTLHICSKCVSSCPYGNA